MVEDTLDTADSLAWALGLHDPLTQVSTLASGAVLHSAPGTDLGDLRSCVCVLGAFDGVHRGHRALVATAMDEAGEKDLRSVAVTFDPDPSQVVGRPQESLLTCADRHHRLGSLGVDGVLVYPFTPELASLDAQGFLGLLAQDLGPSSLHVGEGFRLGKDGRGTGDVLAGAARDLGIALHREPLLLQEGAPISATRIRGLVEEGDVEGATALLGCAPLARGRVIHGRGEGTSMGFPTANVVVDPGICLPASGVFGGWVAVGDSAWPAALNAGLPPMFHSQEVPGGFIEAALLGFQGDLYDREVAVVFHRRLRSSKVFTSVDCLEEVVKGNIEQVAQTLGDSPLPL